MVVRALWKKPLWLTLAGGAAFLTIDLAFFTANLPKVPHGGWLPLAIALVVFTILITWQRGREIVTRNRIEEEGPLRAFVEEVRDADPPIYRAPGTGVFLNSNRETTPLALRAMFEHTRVLHESVVIISIESLRVPHVPPEERVVCDDLGYGDDGISHVTARVGFQDEPNVPAMLRLPRRRGSSRTSTSRTRPTSCRRSRSCRPTSRAWPAGARSCSWRSRATRPARSSTSACRTTAR